MSEQPSILLIVADQLTPFTTSTYGHEIVQTPNLDHLANDGIRYDAAYTSCPLCAPARASLVTGKYASNIRVYDNKSSFSCEEPTVAHYLSLAGYDTVLAGKMHFIGADQLHGFHRRLTGDIFPADFSWQHTNQRESPQDNHATAYLKAGATSWAKNQAYDDTVHAQSLSYLHSSPEPPFFLTVSYQQPHQPFMVPERVWNTYADEDIDLPDLPDDLDSLYSTMENWINRFHGILPVRDQLLQSETLRQMRRAYYGMVTEIDRRVGELIQALEETGQRDNTVIIFTSDHGDMLGERGLIQKRYFYEYSARIPLIVNFPDKREHGSTLSQPASIVDIAPTILTIAGIDDQLPMDGVNLLGNSQDRVIFAEQHVEGVNAPCFMVCDGRYKLIEVYGHDSRLYDVINDPKEHHDLHENPEYTTVLSRLRDALYSNFDPQAIEDDIVASLIKRHLLKHAMKANNTKWDYIPHGHKVTRSTL